uniref:Putative d-beta-hydroxybutyrate dehydrogenase n=1 Tax=Lutzomyia longipalpis TaxID=7200 RepID=A0A7G3AFF8_LUTLO
MPTSGPITKQGSIKRQGSAKRRKSSLGGSQQQTPKEVPWDLFDRLLIPLISCHAVAIILSTILNILRISQVSTFALFIWFALSTTGAVMFYHLLKVSASGKGVLVTGCESPLVWHLARHLDEMGFTVFAGFTHLADSEEAAILKEECSGRMKVLQLDVTSETQMLEASLHISENLPDGARGLWAVIHCAAWVALGEFEWIPFNVLRKAIDINLLGTARLTQIMLPLVRRANGRLVFLSSALARIPSPVRGIQSATQAGIEGLAICLREELRPRGVDVSVVAAGEYVTGTSWLNDKLLMEQASQMWARLSDEQRKVYGKEYFENAIRSLEKYTKVTADFTPAIRSLIDATIRTFPLPRYTPVTRAEKIQTLIAQHLPKSVYDTIYRK